MMELLTDPQAWLAFVTLSLLEIVLGIDNIIFISILVRAAAARAAQVSAHRRPRLRHGHARGAAVLDRVAHAAGESVVPHRAAGGVGA